jgi:hypothetical protein
MSRFLRNVFAALLLVSSLILATIPVSGTAWAQDPGDPPADVARIAAISGSVSSHQPGSQNWEGAQQNYPLAPGSGVWTEPRSHAAVDVAGARIHLDASSQLEVTAINPGQVQLAVPQGAAVVRVYPGVSGVSFQVDTAHGAVTINQPGQYEIVAGDDQHPASVSVIEGQAQFAGQSANLALQAGQRGSITPNGQASVDAAQPDDFVRMVQQAEQPYQQQVAQTAQYVSPQQTGYQDLARYGQWDQAPQYGAVWYPQAVPVNWAPYRYGHWAYVQPWGWTWVDDAAWGFTPFHYGRWVQIRHRWAWVPGERVVRPVYAPALVSFFDLGGVGIGVSLGWVPLGPEEVYVPPYRHSPRYVREVNITNVRNETTIINVVNNKTVVNVNNYRNYRGATSAPRDVMEHGRAVGPAWSKNDKTKFDQQWSQAKPEQEVAFRPQGNAEGKPANGPKFEPRAQQQKWQTNAKPVAQPNQAKAPEPQQQKQPEKTWANTGKPKSSVAAAPKPVTPNAIPLPPSSTAQKPTAPNGRSQDAAAQPKSNKRKNQQPPAITPTAAQPTLQPQPQQEQTSKKAQWKAQQQPKVQVQPQPQTTSRETRKPAQQQWQPRQNGKADQHSDKAPKANQPPAQQQQQPQQQKKQGQNCGQQAGACQ